MTGQDRELHARRAASFGARAGDYAEHRPDYPAAALGWILPATAREVLDLAAGTGKLTGDLLARGLSVTAVEPDTGMLAELSKRFPDATAMIGTAERIPLPDGSVDAVLVGQAFHWFDPPRALSEIARVLRPGGVLATLWNEEDDSVPWVAGMADHTRTSVSDLVTTDSSPFDHPAYGPAEQRLFGHSFRRTAESYAKTKATHSNILVASEEERAAVLKQLVAYLHNLPETQGEFDMPLRTIVIRMYRH